MTVARATVAYSIAFASNYLFITLSTVLEYYAIWQHYELPIYAIIVKRYIYIYLYILVDMYV